MRRAFHVCALVITRIFLHSYNMIILNEKLILSVVGESGIKLLSTVLYNVNVRYYFMPYTDYRLCSLLECSFLAQKKAT